MKGVLEAENRNAVVSSLLSQGYYVMSLRESKQSGKDLSLFDFSLGKIGIRDLVVMTRQLSTMMAAGLSILRCFSILEAQTENKKLRNALSAVKADIEEGLALWEALAKHPYAFSDIYVSMVRAGEVGGVLEPILERLSDHMEREQEISGKVKAASVYPSVIGIVAIVVVVSIITFVMPTFVGMFQSSGVELPGPTRTLLAMSNFIKSSWYVILGGIAILIFILKRTARTPAGRLFFDRLYLHIPVLGKTISRISVARFARTMGTLVRSGIPVLQALEVVESVMGNAVIAQAIHGARESISEGESITTPLEATGVFEPMVTQMIAVGEETGALDEMLIRMSDYFEREVMQMVDTLMAIMEPVLILVVAVMVGGIVIATLMPMFDMMNTVG